MKQSKLEKEAAKVKKQIELRQKEEIKRVREQQKGQSEVAKKDLSQERLRIALERLQINWIQWDITCIALGFTSYKFFYARVEEGKAAVGSFLNGRDIGIFLISLGLVSLFFATLQHRKSVEKLKSVMPTMQYSLSLRVSYVVMIFSIVVFLIVIFRQ